VGFKVSVAYSRNKIRFVGVKVGVAKKNCGRHRFSRFKLWASQVWAVCNCGRHRFSRFVCVRVGLAYSRNIFA